MNKFNLIITLFLIINGSVNAAVIINYPDYSNAPLLDSPATNMVENFQQGYQMAQERKRMQAEQQQIELQNRILEEQLNMLRRNNH